MFDLVFGLIVGGPEQVVDLARVGGQKGARTRRNGCQANLFIVNLDELAVHLVPPPSLFEGLGFGKNHVNRTGYHPGRIGGLYRHEKGVLAQRGVRPRT
jgi:hypothetical protein